MDKKLKIAVLNKYQGVVERGAETFVSEVSKRLEKDFDVDVISKVNYLDIYKKKYNIVIPTNGRVQVFLIRIISWLSGAKMVISGQSGLGADDKWNLLCKPDVFVALTNYQEKWAKKFRPNINIKVIPNGVDIKRFKPMTKGVNFDLPGPLVLTVGALEEIKRHDLLIKACAQTKTSLLIVGKGSRENELQELGNKLMSGRFKIVNFKHLDMPGVYRHADLFAYSTMPWESFGIVMVEAMACNLPIVASDDPIRREIVGDAGIFVNPTNIDAYTDTLEKALSKKWGNIPRKQAEKFNWDEIWNKYKQLFEELC